MSINSASNLHLASGGLQGAQGGASYLDKVKPTRPQCPPHYGAAGAGHLPGTPGDTSFARCALLRRVLRPPCAMFQRCWALPGPTGRPTESPHSASSCFPFRSSQAGTKGPKTCTIQGKSGGNHLWFWLWLPHPMRCPLPRGRGQVIPKCPNPRHSLEARFREQMRA
jgi:hypothetical protein